MAYLYKSFTVTDQNGDAVPNVPVYVYETGTDTLATLYSAASGGALSNPMTTNSNGVASCYQAAGFYDAWFVGTGYRAYWERGYQIATTADGVQSVTADTVLTASDWYTDCDCSNATIAVTLPAAASVLESLEIGIKKIDSSANVVTIADPNGVTIEGAASLQLTLENEGIWLAVRNGVWRIVGRM